MPDLILVLDENTKQPKCVKPITALQSITNLGSSVDATNPNAPVVTVTSSDGADTSFTIPIPAGSTPSITNLGHSIAGTDVTVTSSDGGDTTIPMAQVINNFFAALPNCV